MHSSALLVLVIAILTGGVSAPLPAAEQPNVVVILTDDQGWGDLSLNGNTNLRTPHVDSLAQDGAKFKRFFVQTVCSPTRAEFLTGHWPPRGGVKGVSTGQERLNLDERTIAEAFQAAGQMPPARPTDPVAAHQRRGPPGGLFNGKIHPLIPFAIRGVLWYQGEANTNSPERAALYHHQLQALVTDWRRRWGEELPFAWVQLPNVERPGEGWSLVREGMLRTLQLPNTGMAITLDIGDPKDIHPVNKQEVGRRLALWALGRVYGQKGSATSSPLPAKHTVREGAMVVSFTHTDGGLQAPGGVKGFEIAGPEMVWKPATARIEGETVVVFHPDVKTSFAVRSAWASNPTGNLAHGRGLPASPFRILPTPDK